MDYNKLASQESVVNTDKSLKDKGYEVYVENNKEAVLSRIKKIIPENKTVMNGASVTLEQVGFIEFLKNNEHKWVNMHAQIVAEKDPIKQLKLRTEATSSDYYLGSVHALTESGEFIIASNTGSQLPNIVFNSPNLIFVVSTKKIVPNLDEAFKRLEEYVLPIEAEHIKEKYNMETAINKLLVFKGESKAMGRTVTFILVKEDAGF